MNLSLHIKSALLLTIAAAAFALGAEAEAQTLAGAWSGDLKVSPQITLKLVFHINEDSSITMDSPDQGAYGIGAETVFLSADSVNLKVPQLMMSYAGRLKGDVIEGTFEQGGDAVAAQPHRR